MLVEATDVETRLGTVALSEAAQAFCRQCRFCFVTPAELRATSDDSAEPSVCAVPVTEATPLARLITSSEARGKADVRLIAGGLAWDDAGTIYLSSGNTAIEGAQSGVVPIHALDEDANSRPEKTRFVILYGIVDLESDLERAWRDIMDALIHPFVEATGVLAIIETADAAASYRPGSSIFDWLHIALVMAHNRPGLGQFHTIALLGAQLRLLLPGSRHSGRLIRMQEVGPDRMLRLSPRGYKSRYMREKAGESEETQDHVKPFFASLHVAAERFRLEGSIDDEDTRIFEWDCPAEGVTKWIVRALCLAAVVWAAWELPGVLSLLASLLALRLVWNILTTLAARKTIPARGFGIFTPIGFAVELTDGLRRSLVLIPWAEAIPPLTLARVKLPLMGSIDLEPGLQIFLNASRPRSDFLPVVIAAISDVQIREGEFQGNQVRAWNLAEFLFQSSLDQERFRQMAEWSLSCYRARKNRWQSSLDKLQPEVRGLESCVNAVVLIGVGDYEHVVPKLPGATRDAFYFSLLLESTDCGPYIRQLRNPDVAEFRCGVEQVVADHAGANPSANIVVFYSGHGLVAGEDLLLCGRDTEPSNLEGTAVRFSWILDVLAGSSLGSAIVILDCCHAGLAVDFCRRTSNLRSATGPRISVVASVGAQEMGADFPANGFMFGIVEVLQQTLQDTGMVTITDLRMALSQGSNQFSVTASQMLMASEADLILVQKSRFHDTRGEDAWKQTTDRLAAMQTRYLERLVRQFQTTYALDQEEDDGGRVFINGRNCLVISAKGVARIKGERSECFPAVRIGDFTTEETGTAESLSCLIRLIFRGSDPLALNSRGEWNKNTELEILGTVSGILKVWELSDEFCRVEVYGATLGIEPPQDIKEKVGWVGEEGAAV